LATLLPTPKIQILDSNGSPLESGTIETYIPSTTTAKLTWQDADQTIANSNPIILDSSGEAIVYGSGSYRWIVRDSSGNLVYDQLTADTSSGGIANGGTSTGSANAQVVAASSFSQQDGQALEFIAGFTNSGPMTVAPGGGSGIPVLNDTSTGPAPLSGGEVVAANAVLLLYEAARGAFHLVNPTPGSFSGATITNSTITLSTIDTTTITLKQSSDPTPTAEGDMQWSTLFDNFKVGDGSGTKRFWAGAPLGAISGCTIANNGSDATNDIDFAAGTAADSTNAFLMTLGSTLTKRLDATWAVGNNQGGLFSGSIANTTYHAFLIMRPDTGVVDAGFDTSVTAANRPASYTYYRRVGSIVRTGAAIKAFVQYGKDFLWLVGVRDLNTTGSSTASSLTMTVPSGIAVIAKANLVMAVDPQSSTTYYTLVTALSQTDTTPSATNFTAFVDTDSSINFSIGMRLEVPTNTSAQVRVRSSATSGILTNSIYTTGYTDYSL
jgi:hypothetical protein